MEPESRDIIVEKPFGIFNIELTNHCPMSCVMCPRTHHMSRPQGHMEMTLFHRIIDELVDRNPCYIGHQPLWLHHFGESLLHPRFDDCIRYAVNRGVVTCLSVNPLLLSESVRQRLLQAGPELLYISLDGHDDASFEKIRGLPNAYRRSLRNLERFLEAKQQQGSSCRTVISMIDFDLNRESIERTKAHWISQPGVDDFLMKGFSRWDGAADDINQLDRHRENRIPANSDRVECDFPWQCMTVLWDGVVVPCCNDYDKKLSLGNLSDRTLSEIWNGERMQRLRREFVSNHVTNPLCRDCEKLRLPRDAWEW